MALCAGSSRHPAEAHPRVRIVAFVPADVRDQVARLAALRRESRSLVAASLLAAGLAAQRPES